MMSPVRSRLTSFAAAFSPSGGFGAPMSARTCAALTFTSSRSFVSVFALGLASFNALRSAFTQSFLYFSSSFSNLSFICS